MQISAKGVARVRGRGRREGGSVNRGWQRAAPTPCTDSKQVLGGQFVVLELRDVALRRSHLGKGVNQLLEGKTRQSTLNSQTGAG